MTTTYRVTLDMLGRDGQVIGTESNTYAAGDRTDAIEAAFEFELHGSDAADAVVRLVEEVPGG